MTRPDLGHGVLLINPHPLMHITDGRRGIFRHAPEIPMSIAFLAGYLVEQHIPVDCLDLTVCRNPEFALRERLGEMNPRYVGITSLSAAMPSANAVAKICREALGKDATLIITTGDPLEITTSVEMMFIQGRTVDLSNRQTELYEKYLLKYSQEDAGVIHR